MRNSVKALKSLPAVLLFISCFLIPGHAFAEVIPAPEGRVILKITGKISNTNDRDGILMDTATIKALPATTIRTSTPWTEGVAEFVGISVAELAELAGFQGDALKISALNDYSVTVSLKDLIESGAILAYQLNEKNLSVREKGPLWVIFPFDQDARFRTDAYWSKAVWQIRDIEVR